MSTRSDNLLAAIVQANVDSLASTTDAIVANLQDQVVSFAKALSILAAGIECIPDMNRTAHLDGLLYDVGIELHSARRILRKEYA